MSAQTGEVFKAGEKCRQSGVYRVIHDRTHAENHEVTCVNGETFPTCRDCKRLKFELVRPAHHIETHEYFKHYYSRESPGRLKPDPDGLLTARLKPHPFKDNS